jgi:pimeloyl-ACP methyl ester carboxylesterase
MKPSRSSFITVRGLRYHVRHWGSDDAPVIVMLHGWMDVSASFQFLVDAFARDWHVIAPDWRGFGLSEHAPGGYWYPDYLADLEAILDHYSPQQPVNLLGHSLGANVAGVYAGVRPQRIAKLIDIEGFGLPVADPTRAPARYGEWLDALKDASGLRGYPTLRDVAARLQKTNPRLGNERADFLARHWAAQSEDGDWHILADARHKLPNPHLYRIDEVLACWSRITAPVLWIEARDSELVGRLDRGHGARAEIDRRIAFIKDVTILMVDGAGHMVHHDQPEILAEAIEAFLA